MCNVKREKLINLTFFHCMKNESGFILLLKNFTISKVKFIIITKARCVLIYFPKFMNVYNYCRKFLNFKWQRKIKE